MGILDLLRRAPAPAPLTLEAVEPALQEMTVVELARSAAAQVGAARSGYEFGLPFSRTMQTVGTSERRSDLEQLYSLYLVCPWASASVDAIARSITAGGLEIFIDQKIDEQQHPKEPSNVKELRNLLTYTNPHQDIIQLLRHIITDLLVFGDAYIEVVSLGNRPVALYTLDPVSMVVRSDDHGEILGYTQDVDGIHKVNFDTDQVIHIQMDAPRGGLYGVSPTQKSMLSITAWIFTEACIKECFRKGDPPNVHVDFPQGTKDADMQRWHERYQTTNMGSRNMGTPIITVGGGVVKELSVRKVSDYLSASTQLRDEILSGYGVLPAKVGVIESGNLGGGTAEGQDKTWRVNTIIPISNLVLEKLNYALVRRGFGIKGWHLEFVEIDFRDSKVVEEIRDVRIKNGTFTLNRARGEIGEPPVEGGDTAVLVDRQNLVLWKDLARASEAGINKNLASAVAAGIDVPGVKTKVPPANDANKDASGAPGYTAGKGPGGTNTAPRGTPAKESILEATHAGSMVALYIPMDVAEAIAIPGYEEPGELHITLGYLAEDAASSGINLSLLQSVVSSVSSRYAGELTGAIQGLGYFNVPDAGRVIWASPDLPGLAEFRQHLVDELSDAGIEVSNLHGFTPHITLAYVGQGQNVAFPEIESQALSFGGVTLTWGDERYFYPFGASDE